MEVSAKVFGPKMGLVPYVMPGFDLAKLAAEVFDRDPTVDGLILDKHGIFTFGATAKEAYDRMIHYVTLAEDYVAKNGRNPFTPAALPATLAKPNDIAAMLLQRAVAVSRGEGRCDRMIGEFRTSPAILDFVNAAQVEDMASRGVSTPDLSIRIKTGPMVLPAPDATDLNGFKEAITERVAAFAKNYTAYFEANDGRDDVKRVMLDPMPRLTLSAGTWHVWAWPHPEGCEDRRRCGRNVDRSGA